MQGCARGSPAAGALCSWGRGLRKGDQVLEVSGRPIRCMTRAQCVRELKGEKIRTIFLRSRGYYYFPQLN